MSKYKADYTHLYTGLNNEYEQGLVDLGLRRSLLNNNSEIDSLSKPVFTAELQPKYVTSMREIPYNDWGELDHKKAKIYLTDSHKQAGGRTIKKLFDFCNYYQPLYKTKEVSCILHTLTTANDVFQMKGMTMSKMMDTIKYRYETINRPIRGYFWVSEVSKDLHWHYHLVTAIDRLNIRGKGIPSALKFEDVWGARTGTEFVKRSIRTYLSNYMAKDNCKIIGQRKYSSSQQFK